MNTRLQIILPAALAGAAALVCSSAALAAPTWLTIGERAHALLVQVAPQAQTSPQTLASREVQVTLPVKRGGSALTQGVEVVHAVQVDDAALPLLSEAVHSQLNRCGGFAQHASMAEALATLHRLQGTPAPAPAVSYAIDNVAEVNAMLPQLQASNILATIQSLSDFQNRRYNSSHGVAASDWLFSKWKSLDPGDRRNIRVTQIPHAGWPQKSVQFEIVGSTNELIILGGHLDSIAGGAPETARAPGADDDASGVAILTEVIRVLMASNYQPKRTVRFIAYAAEEVGLLGSQAIAAAQALQRVRLVGVLQLDMTAYQGDATDLWLISDYTDAAQNGFLAALAAAYLPGLTVGFDACGYACSDHASWFNRGYVASFPFEATLAHSNPTIHSASDTIATFGGQANHALKFSQLALAYAVELGSDLP